MDQNITLDANNYLHYSFHHNLKSIYEPNSVDSMLAAIQLPAISIFVGMLILGCIVSLINKHQLNKKNKSS